MTREDSDYKVGYKQPPKHSRFKKGESGNKKGRPKIKDKKMKIEDYIMLELQSKIKISENGVPKTITKEHAIAKAFISKILSGDQRSLKLYFDNYNNKILPRLEEIVQKQIRQEESLAENVDYKDPIRAAEAYKALIQEINSKE